MSNIAIFYTARVGSTRLPNKMILDLQGKTVFEHGLLRILVNNKNIPVILCTTFLSEDDVLVKMANTMKGVQSYRGAVTDVLERYLGAARQFGIDFFVVVDGDDLFIEPLYIQKIFDCFFETNADYISIEGLPYGTYGSGVKVDALEHVCRIKDDVNTEGWGRYFFKTNLFHLQQIHALEEHRFPEYRLTLDYPEDLELVRVLYTHLYKEENCFFLDQLFTFLKKYPKISKLNWNRKKEYEQRFNKKYSNVQFKK
ncbi:MAG: hypothetical protein COU30_03795 [Candidatus Magasanikbacteria bacterium CG10_big_fil_rev_8_21_14_0_10_38_6]|uniref:Acylneuraminate cytidylyltransferase n=1 Tax=Candidatus Magasanikbacteria bacterium CG10_big_fil_rev_8_21_14_0_10_38_6 TaxID=1974647 RepID=A0A2M6P0E0_9BACT|nr:hypothetical protein [Candidatus Falkowbacteria bacterium]PIR77193.1 MAG: hypothetical protein COU30_03795 [Candidatus Magasanikbacteria bacterium CG10_big_fil_rev_8_21_14_0_10_38_6]